jgi:hypothetical protein
MVGFNTIVTSMCDGVKMGEGHTNLGMEEGRTIGKKD